MKFQHTKIKQHLFNLLLLIRPKKKNCYVALTRPKFKNWVGRSGFFFFFFFFFLRTVRELSFPIFFLKFLNGENSGGMQSKRIYKSCKCFFKPLNTNFSKFFAQIWHKKKKKKKPWPCFFRILRSVGRGQHKIFFFGLIKIQPWIGQYITYYRSIYILNLNFWIHLVSLHTCLT